MRTLASSGETMLPAPGLVPKDCASCPWIKPCGGHQLEIIRAIGCANHANAKAPFDPNDMTPVDDDRFWELSDDVNGLFDFDISRIEPIHSHDLPTYIPLLQHPYSRTGVFTGPIAALHLYQVFRKDRDGHYRCRFTNGAELRARYRLGPEVKIILCGVAVDRRLELFWAHHRQDAVAVHLARLGIIGVTVPNFSFFTDVTRFQILRNRKRIVLMTERLSEAGVPVAPHLNALTDRDWEFWYELLRDHPATSVVTLEFQTGLATQDEGREALQRVANLQQKLGRLLHPILVAGAKHYLEAQSLFTRFSVLDSRPFMEAQARRMLVGDAEKGFRWMKTPTATGEPIDRLFATSAALYPEKLKIAPAEEIYVPWSDPAQMELLG